MESHASRLGDCSRYLTCLTPHKKAQRDRRCRNNLSVANTLLGTPTFGKLRDARTVWCRNERRRLCVPLVAARFVMNATKMHSLAHEFLLRWESGYASSKPLCKTLAKHNPRQCVTWAFGLVEPYVNASSPHDIVIETLNSLNAAIPPCSADDLPRLNELALLSWSSGSFDGSSPYLQKAVARLAWATMHLICHVASCSFESESGTHFGIDKESAFTELVGQCSMAIDMIWNETNEGRLLIASSFSREMETLS